MNGAIVMLSGSPKGKEACDSSVCARALSLTHSLIQRLLKQLITETMRLKHIKAKKHIRLKQINAI